MWRLSASCCIVCPWTVCPWVSYKPTFLHKITYLHSFFYFIYLSENNLLIQFQRETKTDPWLYCTLKWQSYVLKHYIKTLMQEVIIIWHWQMFYCSSLPKQLHINAPAGFIQFTHWTKFPWRLLRGFNKKRFKNFSVM